MASPEAVTAALLAYGRTVDPAVLTPALTPEARRLVHEDPFAFLLGASLDRGIKAEAAWTFPYWIRERLGHLDPARISRMEEPEVRKLLESLPKKPRYMNVAPATVLELARIVAGEFGGDAASLWKGRSSREVESILLRIPGVGQGIASMTVGLLETCFQVRFSDADRRAMDVKPDVHVVRVLGRLGMTEGWSPQEALAAARRLSPDHPWAVDIPLWLIGRSWCHASGPDCPACPMDEVCPKAGATRLAPEGDRDAAAPPWADTRPPPRAIPAATADGVVALLSCTKRKASERCKARDLYHPSALFRMARGHVEGRGLPWLVLSAKYGVLAPEDEVDPYEQTLKEMRRSEVAAWAERVTADMAKRFPDPGKITFEFHAGSEYVKPLSGPLSRLGYRFNTPLEGMKIGQRLAWYRRAVGPTT